MTQPNWAKWKEFKEKFALLDVDKAKQDWQIYQEMLKSDKLKVSANALTELNRQEVENSNISKVIHNPISSCHKVIRAKEQLNKGDKNANS